MTPTSSTSAGRTPAPKLLTGHNSWLIHAIKLFAEYFGKSPKRLAGLLEAWSTPLRFRLLMKKFGAAAGIPEKLRHLHIYKFRARGFDGKDRVACELKHSADRSG